MVLYIYMIFKLDFTRTSNTIIVETWSEVFLFPILSKICFLTFQWIAKSKNPSDVQLKTWHFLQQMKNKIIEMVDSENEGWVPLIASHAWLL